jgi:hypothetical protein
MKEREEASAHSKNVFPWYVSWITQRKFVPLLPISRPDLFWGADDGQRNESGPVLPNAVRPSRGFGRADESEDVRARSNRTSNSDDRAMNMQSGND